MRRVRATTVAVERQYYLFWVCVLTLGKSTKWACAILSSVTCPALQYFSTLPHKRHDFRTKVMGYKMWGGGFYNGYLKHFLEEMSKIWSKMYIGLHVQYPLLLSGCNVIWIFFYRFSKNFQILNFMKIRPVGDDFFDAGGGGGADGRTDGQTRRSYSRFSQLRQRA